MGKLLKIYIKGCKLLYNVPLLETPRQCVITRPNPRENIKQKTEGCHHLSYAIKKRPNSSSFNLFLGRSNMCVVYLLPSVKYETAKNAGAYLCSKFQTGQGFTKMCL